jgi:flagellar motor switch protein FliN/FliY
MLAQRSVDRGPNGRRHPMADASQNAHSPAGAAEFVPREEVTSDPAAILADSIGRVPSQAEHLVASLRAEEESEHSAEQLELVPFRLQELASEATPADRRSRDVELNLTIELGRTRMRLEEASTLCVGAIATLDQLPNDPVDVYVNGRLVARGELAVMHETFCVRVTELIARRAAA